MKNIIGKSLITDKKKVEETRTVPFIFSTEVRDRYGTKLLAENWQLDNFNANGIVGYQHNLYGDMCNAPNPDDVLGIGKAWINGNILIGEIEFETLDINPLAEKIFKKILNGTLKAVSVGFQETEKGYFGKGDEEEGGKLETYYYGKQELLEISVVNMPANPEALIRNERNDTTRAIKFLADKFEKKVSEIEDMTVKEIINRMQGNAENGGFEEAEKIYLQKMDIILNKHKALKK